MRACVSLNESQHQMFILLGGSRFLQKVLDDQMSTIYYNRTLDQYRTLLQLLDLGVKNLSKEGWIYVSGAETVHPSKYWDLLSRTITK